MSEFNEYSGAYPYLNSPIRPMAAPMYVAAEPA